MTMQPKNPTNNAAELDLTRCFAESDRQRGLTRRSQAMLAAAGMAEPARLWFVVTVEHGFDRAVAQTLAFADVEVWLPSVTAKPVRRGGMRGRRETVGRLALPGYLFVKVAADIHAWSGLATIKGVIGMLGNEGRPTAVADKAVALFKAYLADDPEAIATVTNAVRKGNRVVVKDGPFRAFSGVVERLDEGAGRAIVEIVLFGRVTPVHLDIGKVVRVE